MLIESAISNLATNGTAIESAKIDWLDLTWLECCSRAFRKQTRSGFQLRILLRIQKTLHHGDILGQNSAGSTIAVNLLPAAILLMQPRNQNDWATLGFELGNLHVPIEITDHEMATPCDASIEALLDRLAIPFQTQTRRFQPNRWPPSVRLAETLRITKI